MSRANRQFVENTKVKSGLKVHRRKVVESNDEFILKEQSAPYNAHFGTEKYLLRPGNMYY